MASLVSTRLGAAADFRLTARQAQLGAGAVALTLALVVAAQILLSQDYMTPAGTPVGGDFAAFWTAAKALAAGDAAAIYDPAVFQAWLARVAPGDAEWTLFWQYPPTYFLAIGFLAATPYWLGYALWSGGGLAVFAASSRAAGVSGAALFCLLAAPVVFQSVITGQNGFLTASLLLGATLLPDRRPLIAGACAALLTVKPQLGLLIPVAYVAGGHWRAFGAAAAGTLALAGASVLAFGIAPWTAFFDSLVSAGGRVGDGVMPLYKMPTAFAAFSMAGFPAPAALAFHLAGAAAAVCATACVWRKSDSAALKAAVVCCGAFLVAPYVYYYDLVIVAPPVALLAMASAREGWRRRDHLILAGLFLLPMLLPGEPAGKGFNLSFAAMGLSIVFILRQLKPRHP